MKFKVVLIVMLAMGAGYALAIQGTETSINPVAYFNLKAGQNTRLDLVILRHGEASIPCVVSMVEAREGVVNRASGSGISCAWPDAAVKALTEKP